tara:strand:- start:1203 stop:2315 length:1113 start_codon:yes stop_codon:yes gene_type:complete
MFQNFFRGFVFFNLVASAALAAPEEQTLVCPDGRTIQTQNKSSIDQRAKTADLVVEEKVTTFDELPGWGTQDELDSLALAISNNCRTRKLPEGWKAMCKDMTGLHGDALLSYVEKQFVPHRLSVNQEEAGKVTGYYASYVNVDTQKSERYRYPLYKYAKGVKKLSRDQIDGGAIHESHVLFWADNAFDAYILAVQGSGVGKLPNGEKVKILYAGKNNRGYVSIGKVLKECGTIAGRITLPVIEEWVNNASDEEYLRLIGNNQSYVFFRKEAYDQQAPKGSLGVPLTAMRSIAVDRRYFTLGSMMYLSLPHPLDDTKRIERLVLAQDTGGAINGGLRADLFIGEGEWAHRVAGILAHPGQFWILKPKSATR